MICFPNAKINIGLNILSKREDGFHNIESYFYPIPLYDVLEIIPSKDFEFVSYGLPINCKKDENLCIKSFKLIKDTFNISNVKIILLKNIPLGSGLGGGSSDAAFTIKLLDQIFELNLNTDQLIKLALKIGSDCGFFINNKPSFVSGRGEFIHPATIDLKSKKLFVFHPNIETSTKEAFLHFQLKTSKPSLKNQIINNNIEDWKNQLKNDFEPYLEIKIPEYQRIKEKLYKSGADYVSFTGSGSSFYAIYTTEPDIDFSETGLNFKEFIL